MHSFRFTATLTTGIAAFLFTPILFAQAPILATGDMRTVHEPTYPAVCETLMAQFSSSQRANPPAADDTSRIQAAFNNCANSGESVVLAATSASDAFYSNKLDLKAGETLVVGQGVTLFGNNSYSSQSELIYAKGANMGIMGPGTIDGRGDLISGTPRLIEAMNLDNFAVYNVTLTHAAKMHLYMENGQNVTVWHLTIASPATKKNTDGVDIDSLHEVTVAHSSIEAGDDGIAVKTNSAPAYDITVKDNLLYGTHGLSIGSQTMYGVTNVLWEHNTVFGTNKFGEVSTDNDGIRIKSDPTCGGNVTQVTYLNTQLIGVKHLMDFNTNYGSCSSKITPHIPYYQDIVVAGFISANSQSGAYSEFQGHDASLPLGLYLANVHLDSTVQYNKLTGNNDSQYANVGIFNSNIVPSGTGVTTFNLIMPPPVH